MEQEITIPLKRFQSLQSQLKFWIDNCEKADKKIAELKEREYEMLKLLDLAKGGELWQKDTILTLEAKIAKQKKVIEVLWQDRKNKMVKSNSPE